MHTDAAKKSILSMAILKSGNLLRKAIRDFFVSLRYLPIRRKIMIVSILLIGASFYTAPVGVLLLSAYIAIEWKEFQTTAEGRMTFLQFIRKSIFFIPGTILVLSAFIGAILHRHYVSSLLAVFVLAPIIFCATAIQFLWKREDSLHFARYSVMLILPVSIYSLFSPWSGSYFFEIGKSLRLKGTFANPNYFSYALELFLVLALALFYHVWERRTLNKVIISFAVGLVCLYFTGSRTGIIAFMVGLMVFFFSMSEKKLLSAAFALIALLLAMGAIFPEKVVELVSGIIPRSAEYIRGFENRFELWNIAIRQIKKNPFIGTGLYTYSLYVPVNAPAPFKDAVHAHNIFLNFWLETGLFGILSFLAILLRTAVFALKRLNASPMRPYLAAGLGIIAITMVHGIMDAPLVSAQTIAFFGIFLGTACITRDEKKFPTKPAPGA
ncbi:MAG: O-antigen ligase family protein [Saccharofermentanales bacterium]